MAAVLANATDYDVGISQCAGADAGAPARIHGA